MARSGYRQLMRPRRWWIRPASSAIRCWGQERRANGHYVHAGKRCNGFLENSTDACGSRASRRRCRQKAALDPGLQNKEKYQSANCSSNNQHNIRE